MSILKITVQGSSLAAQTLRANAARAFSSAAITMPLTSSSSSSSSSSSATTTLSTASSASITTSLLGGLGSYIADLLPSIVWASVPKHRTSHSKKRMRQATKGLKVQKNIVECPGCGRPKLMHHLCTHCYREMKGRGPTVSSA
ncbi:hypothetical protein DFQ27_005300 [Actinomortierella ambigua]|uniref:Large ribosomal subunit protein bL32m n=1 Tax=Actinomortierella ambigua TaxID=1343610 RepID=A0A9P6PZ66_9FUNG|nr:hypothetical protein DFQ27_005300 [Actinomortierella ambigua]